VVRESRKGLRGRFASGHRGGGRRFTCRSPTAGASGLEATPVFFRAGARMYDLPIGLFDVGSGPPIILGTTIYNHHVL
jgi:hypothetical protein